MGTKIKTFNSLEKFKHQILQSLWIIFTLKEKQIKTIKISKLKTIIILNKN